MNISDLNLLMIQRTEVKPFYLFRPSKLLELVVVVVLPPFTILSIISNFISYRVFSSSQLFQKPLYVYLKVTCLNSILINLIFGLSFIWTSRLFGPVYSFGFHKWQVYVQCYIIFPLVMISYSFGYFLEVVLALERICELTDSRHRFQRFKPSVICIGLLLFSFLLHLPMVLSYEPRNQLLYDNSTKTSDFIFYPDQTTFNLSTLGYINQYVRFIFRDILPFSVLLVINIASFIHFRRKFMSKKAGLIFRNRILSVNKMLTKMVMIICTISTFQSIFFILSFVFLKYYKIPLSGFFISMLLFSLFLKHSINFVIFYNCNSLFRYKLKMLMNIK